MKIWLIALLCCVCLLPLSLHAQINNGGGSGLPAGPTVNGIYVCGYTVTASAAVAATCPQVGVVDGTINGAATMYTVLFSDTTGAPIIHDLNATQNVSVTLPTPTTLTNPAAFVVYENHSSHTDTITPTTWTIQRNTDAIGTSISVPPGSKATITVDPFNANNWLADIVGLSPSLTTGFVPQALTANTVTNSACDHGITNATFQTCSDVGGLILNQSASVVETGWTPCTGLTIGTGGGKCSAEGTAPSGMAAATDTLYGSSAFQAWTAINHGVNEGPTLTASRNLIWNANQAAQSQVVVSGTEYYITKSDLDMPAIYRLAIGSGTVLHWRIALTKTAAGTGTFQLLLKKGTNGSTADSTSATITIGTQTAAADNMEADVTITFTSATAYYYSVIPRQSAATGTGFGLVYPATAAQFTGTVSGLTTTTASDKYGLSVIFTTGTPTFVVNEVFATANGVL